MIEAICRPFTHEAIFPAPAIQGSRPERKTAPSTESVRQDFQDLTPHPYFPEEARGATRSTTPCGVPLSRNRTV